MSDKEEDGNSLETLQSRQRREKKELQAKIQGMKKAVSKGDKRKKKVTNQMFYPTFL